MDTSPPRTTQAADPHKQQDDATAKPSSDHDPVSGEQISETVPASPPSPSPSPLIVPNNTPMSRFITTLVSGGDVAKLSAASVALVMSPVVLVGVLGTFFLIDTLISSWGGRLFGFSYDLVFFVGVFGALGATVSVMLHMGDSHNWTDLSPLDVFFKFLFRPFLGFVFAVLALLVIRAGIVPDSLNQLQAIRDLNDIGNSDMAADTGQQVATMLLIAFVAGFSERLVKAILQTLEGRIRALAIGSDNAKST
ncbi:hypothetical protein [Thalassospira sp. MCCC 1A01428]|uniref:hypothetical protein n=1 Tax=Thalassospira sp. MCCC 1A01428 TaxID=1470575 RepID=UPI000A1E67E3|nr:hypothetical protein [Thalassospira sp. MCCC 1A01428]